MSKLHDARKLPIFIHSQIDDMTDLTPNAMRVYMHLARRADKNGVAWPSYKSIGDHCFKSVSDNPATRKSFARKAIDDLVAAGLIERRARKDEDGSHSSNDYILLDPMSIDTPMLNKHTPMPIDTPLCLISTKDTPSEDTPIEGEREGERGAALAPAHHPAVQVFREVWQRYPSKAQMPIIAQAVEDMDGWRAACQAWASAGYKPTNVTGMLDWYAHPEKYLTPYQAHTNGYPTKAEQNDAVFARMRERIGNGGRVNSTGNYVQQLPERTSEREVDRQLPAPPVQRSGRRAASGV